MNGQTPSQSRDFRDSSSRLDLRPAALNRTIVSLAVPAIVANVLFSLVFFVDTLIVGWLKNEVYLAAVALSSLIMFWSNAPIQGISIAATSLVSRTWGERDFDLARRLSAHCLILTFIIVGVMTLVGLPLAPWIIRLLQASDEVVAPGAKYLRLVLLSSIFGMPLLIANTILRAKGDTKTPMYITGAMNLINIVASIVLAFGMGPFPKMELYGVAWGTVISRNLGGLAGLWILSTHARGISLRFSDFRHIRSRLFARIWHVSHPAIAERVINSTTYAFFMAMVARLGTTTLAAHELALNIESLAFMPSFGISIATSTIIGQAVGAGRQRIGQIAVKRTAIFSTAVMGGIGLLFILFAPQAVKLFRATPEVLELAGLALQIAGLELPMFALVFIFIGALRGAGDTKSAMLVNSASILLFRLPGTYLMGFVFGWGIAGVWMATVLDWTGRALGSYLIFRKGVWKKIHQQEKEKFSK